MKADSKDAAKTSRKARHDPAQKKPTFLELTALWFGDTHETEWKATKAKFGDISTGESDRFSPKKPGADKEKGVIFSAINRHSIPRFQ